jgi:CubicO group peptidase (beta-lactamase class C family)
MLRVSALGWLLCALAATASFQQPAGAQELLVVAGPSEAQQRAQRLVDAWARTGNCGYARLAGRCGLIAALLLPSPPGRDGALESVIVHAAAGGGRPDTGSNIHPSALFEIASNTKVLTAVVLHRMVEMGAVSMGDTVASLLPPTIVYTNRSVGRITLRQLASHTSGLPRLPSNMNGSAHPANPFEGYSASDLYAFLGALPSLPTRGRFLYSNLGFGLLGHLLARR